MESKRRGGRDAQPPSRAELGYGLCGNSRLEGESSGVLKSRTDLFGWLPGCEEKGNVKSSGVGHLPDPLSLPGIGWGGRKETNLGMLCLSGDTICFPHSCTNTGGKPSIHTQNALDTPGRANRPQQPTFVLLCSFTQFRKFEPHQVLVSHQDVFLGEKKGHSSDDSTGLDSSLCSPSSCYLSTLERVPRTVAGVVRFA